MHVGAWRCLAILFRLKSLALLKGHKVTLINQYTLVVFELFPFPGSTAATMTDGVSGSCVWILWHRPFATSLFTYKKAFSRRSNLHAWLCTSANSSGNELELLTQCEGHHVVVTTVSGAAAAPLSLHSLASSG